MSHASTVTYHCDGCEHNLTMNASYEETWMLSCPCGQPLMGKVVSEFTIFDPVEAA